MARKTKKPVYTIPKGSLPDYSTEAAAVEGAVLSIPAEVRRRVMDHLRSKVRRSQDDFERLIDAYATNPDLNNKDVRELWGCSQPQALKALRIVREESAYMTRLLKERREVARATGQPTEGVLDSDIGSRDLVTIADTAIRRLSTTAGDKSTDAQLLKWMDYKTKLQNLRAEEQILTVNPEKLLGFQGLVGMTDKLITHLRVLVKHRDLVPAVFDAMCEMVDEARAASKPEESADVDQPA